MSLKKHFKSIWTQFWASKSTTKAFELDFEPQKVPQKHFHSILSLKKYLKSIWTRFLASKSTAKAFGLHFDPQKAPQKHFNSILSLKKYRKRIWTLFWASKSITKTFWDLLFSSGRVGAYCIRLTNDSGRDRKERIIIYHFRITVGAYCIRHTNDSGRGRKLFGINISGIYGVRTERRIVYLSI